MTVRFRRMLLVAVALGASAASAMPVNAQGWVEAIASLHPSPGDLNDPRLPLPERLELARTLGAYGPSAEAVPVLLAALRRDQDPALRDELLLAIARRAPASAADLLAGQLADGKSPTPMLALALAEIGSARAMQALVRALGRDEARYGVERALRRAGPRAVGPLAAALSGPNAARAARLLGRLGETARPAAPRLVRALRVPAPELRAAAAQALGEIGAREACEPLFARLRDAAPEVVRAALLGLAALAGEEHGERLLGYLSRVEAEQRPHALLALARAAPDRARPALRAALADKGSALRVQALIALEQGDPPSPAFVPLLEALFTGELREASAGALARVPEGAGVAALLRAGARSPDVAERAARAIAIAVRTHADDLSGGELDRAYALLRSLPRDGRALVLRGLARDPELAAELKAALRTQDASVRASAAHAIELLGREAAVAAGPALRAALLRETDAEAARRMLSAAAAIELRLTLAEIWPRLRGAETASEAMPLAVRALPESPDMGLRVYLRRALSPASPPRARAGAALALAALGDRTALPALRAALADASTRVRLAAVRALGRLGGEEAVQIVRDRARIERDEIVRSAALDVAAARGEPRAGAAGTRVLEVIVDDPGAGGSARAPFDVQLPDGRWLLLRPTRGGELIVADLPEGAAEIH